METDRKVHFQKNKKKKKKKKEKKEKKQSRRAFSVRIVNKQRNGLRVTRAINHPSRGGKENFTSFLFWSLNIFFSHEYESSLLVYVAGQVFMTCLDGGDKKGEQRGVEQCRLKIS